MVANSGGESPDVTAVAKNMPNEHPRPSPALTARPAFVPVFVKGDRAAFQKSTEPFRAELLFHCYRMLGSLHDAEDAVQESFLRAWRAHARFKGEASVRNWLYRIATNSCLSALSTRSRRRRYLPNNHNEPTDRMPGGAPATDIAWLEPFPGTAFEQIPDPRPGPDARYEMRDTVRLAFVAAIQHLPPRQRAILLFRDVLGWSAADTAKGLAMTVAAVNSGLQRARSKLEGLFPEDKSSVPEMSDKSQQTLVERYVKAWEEANLNGLVALLQEDATMVMPPWPQWYRGRSTIRRFFSWAFDWAWESREPTTFRLLPTSANGQPALAFYVRHKGAAEFHAHAIQLLTPGPIRISSLTLFVGPQFFPNFNFPQTLPLSGKNDG